VADRVQAGPSHGLTRAARPAPPRRRVLFALDVFEDCGPPLEAAIALARRLDADVAGLLIEDEDVLALAHHPGTAFLSMLTIARQTVGPTDYERAYRYRVETLRRQVEAISQRRQVQIALEVRRGRMEAEVVASCAAGDLIVVTWSYGAPFGGALGRRARAGAAAAAIAEAATGSVLLLRESNTVWAAFLVAYDGSAAAEQAFAAAAELAGRNGGHVTVLLVTRGLEQASAWGARLAERAAAEGLNLVLLQGSSAAAEDVCAAAARLGPVLLVLGADQSLAQAEAGRALLDRVGCSVLLVR